MSLFEELSLREISVLTEEQIESHVRIACMEFGVEVPAPFVEIPLPEPIKASGEGVRVRLTYRDPVYSYDTCIEIGFRTLESAKAFLALGPVVMEKLGDLEGDVYGVCVPSASSLNLVNTVEANAPNLTTRAEDIRKIRQKNNEGKKEYETMQERYEGIRDNVWEKVREAKCAEATFTRIMDTLNEYQVMAKGNREVAMGFLLKIYPEHRVQAAFQWFGLPWEDYSVKCAPSESESK